ncbi:hypothetical protein M4I33_10125 [Clostridium sp. LY3-2]|uniref:hypothetical protein n=1 Tax=Clostridium sp. LY3-2 TaxID=2942482 RepID=UPI002152355F|nr:hypothetical protein [Clostridium sp. LY3-2]MCR6515224.1 hypothetical protein [Clostridium sp. LY3-2]
MKKRLIGSLIAGIMIFSLVGCGGSEKSEGEGSSTQVSSEESDENKDDSNDESKENLDSGQRKITKEEIVQLADKYSEEMKKLMKEDGYPISEWDKYKSGVVKNDYVGDECAKMKKGKDMVEHVELDFSESNNAGCFGINVVYKLDDKAIKEGKDFDLRKTPFEKYGSVLLKDLKLNYDELNKKLNEKYREEVKEDEEFEVEDLLYEEKEGNVIKVVAYDGEVHLDVISPQYIYK